MWPIINIKLNPSQVVKKINEIIEKGRNILSFVCSLFFNIRNPPNEANTKPISNGWCDHEIKPSIPYTSWDKESPNPEIIWIPAPIITSLIPVFRDLLTDLFSKSILPINAAKEIRETPM